MSGVRDLDLPVMDVDVTVSKHPARGIVKGEVARRFDLLRPY